MVVLPLPEGQPWVCPKCGRVWAWYIAGCPVCNAPKPVEKFTDGTADEHNPVHLVSRDTTATDCVCPHPSYLCGDCSISGGNK